MNKRYRPLLSVTLVIILWNCKFFHTPPVTILEYKPTERIVRSREGYSVSITFSADMNKASAEEAFSLASDRGPLEGRFTWEGNTMRFTPVHPPGKSGTYTFRVAESAEDINGNNLRDELIRSFSFSEDAERPEVISLEKESGELRIRFSEGIDRESLYRAFVLDPPEEGSFVWEDRDTLLTFLPATMFSFDRLYTIRIEASLADKNGMLLGEDFLSTFIFNSSGVLSVLSAEIADQGIDLIPGDKENPMIINEGLECFTDLDILFSKKVDMKSLSNGTFLFPELPVSIRPKGVNYADEVTLSFEEPPAYDILYRLTLKDTIEDNEGITLRDERTYFFRCTGPRSRPPEILKVAFLDDPGLNDIHLYNSFDLVGLHGFEPHTPGQNIGFFDLYFRIAETAEIEPIALMDALTISVTNNCADIRALGIETEGFLNPPPIAPEEDETVIRVYVSIEDYPENGLIQLTVSSALEDNLGNPFGEDWFFILNEATP